MRYLGFGSLLLLLLLLAGCSESVNIGKHDGGGGGGDASGGDPCGPTTCTGGTVCCNESCGICVAPGQGCILIACVDGGAPNTCGGEPCDGQCCTDCDGSPYCSDGDVCPELVCPPPPPSDGGVACGSEACAPGQMCCPLCGTDTFCVDADTCPVPVCPPPEDGGTGQCGGRLGLSCPDGWFCDYPEGSFCGAADEPGVCRAADPESSCPEIWAPVCGCDNMTYSSECFAEANGTDVAYIGECESAPPLDCRLEGCPNGGMCVQCMVGEYVCILPGVSCAL